MEDRPVARPLQHKEKKKRRDKTVHAGFEVRLWSCIWEVAQFESWPGHRLSWQVFRRFTQSLQKNSGIVPRFGHDRFLPSPLQFIYHLTNRHNIDSRLEKFLYIPHESKAVPWDAPMGRLTFGILKWRGSAIVQAVSRRRRPGFEPRSSHVGFAVEKVAVGQVFF
jgi:hypothetical protein